MIVLVSSGYLLRSGRLPPRLVRAVRDSAADVPKDIPRDGRERRSMPFSPGTWVALSGCRLLLAIPYSYGKRSNGPVTFASSQYRDGAILDFTVVQGIPIFISICRFFLPTRLRCLQLQSSWQSSPLRCVACASNQFAMGSSERSGYCQKFHIQQQAWLHTPSTARDNDLRARV